MASYHQIQAAAGPELPEQADPTGVNAHALFVLTAEFNGSLPGIYICLEANVWQRVGLALPTVLALIGASVTWTNMASAQAEFGPNANYRTKIDLSKGEKLRLVRSMGVAGSASAVIWLQYSTDQSNWFDLMTERLACGTLGVLESAWEDIPAGAKQDVFIRIVGSGGNGTLDPQFRRVELQVR
jgi:hypothetical protein